MTSTRILEATPELFRHHRDIPEVAVADAVRAPQAPALTLKLLMVTDDMECLEVRRPKGHVDTKRRDADHTTIGCLLEGRLRLHIGGETFIAEPGDVWTQPMGVEHGCEALEASVEIQVKSPACKTW
jgi:hypothetical protein